MKKILLIGCHTIGHTCLSRFAAATFDIIIEQDKEQIEKEIKQRLGIENNPMVMEFKPLDFNDLDKLKVDDRLNQPIIRANPVDPFSRTHKGRRKKF